MDCAGQTSRRGPGASWSARAARACTPSDDPVGQRIPEQQRLRRPPVRPVRELLRLGVHRLGQGASGLGGGGSDPRQGEPGDRRLRVTATAARGLPEARGRRPRCASHGAPPGTSTSSSSAPGRPACRTAWALGAAGLRARRGLRRPRPRRRARRRLAVPLALADLRHHPPRARPARPARSSRTTDSLRAAEAVPAYFAEYERRFDLPVHRPVASRAVRRPTTTASWSRPTPATGPRGAISTRPAPGSARSCPATPARRSSAAASCTPSTTARAAEFAGRHVVVVGGGISATQLLDEISTVTRTTWVTRRPPVLRDGPFDEDAGRRGRRAGRGGGARGPPARQRRRRHRAARSTPYIARRPRPRRPRPAADVRAHHRRTASRGTDGPVRRAPTSSSGPPASAPRVITSRRCGCARPAAGSAWTAPQVAGEPRIHLVGYGPSASTIGANRAGQAAARRLRRLLHPDRGTPPLRLSPRRQGRFRVGSGLPPMCPGPPARQAPRHDLPPSRRRSIA